MIIHMARTNIIRSHDFIDRKGILVQPCRKSPYNASKGKAYAFFNCTASKETIEAELLTIRSFVQTPSELELKLIEGVDNLKGDSQLTSLAKEAKDAGNNYVLEATYAGATNRKTADETVTILNLAYQTPSLYQEGEQFCGEIAYEDNGSYIFSE